ncbi:RHS repeat-associated core domain-containing protein [Lysobacter tyrosinilyticus]
MPRHIQVDGGGEVAVESCWWEYTLDDFKLGGGGSPGGGAPGEVGGSGGSGSTDKSVGDKTKEKAKPTNCNETTQHPVQVASGNKIKAEVDFVLPPNEMPLGVARFYDKSLGKSGIFGPKWSSSLDYTVTYTYGTTLTCSGMLNSANICNSGSATLTEIKAFRPGGSKLTFTKGTDGVWRDQLGDVFAPSGSNWVLTLLDGGRETYDATGKPLTLLGPRGIGLTYTYVNGRLSTVTHSSGRALQIAWATNPVYVSAVTAPNGKTYSYSYTGGYLSGVTYPDSLGTRTYHYEDASQAGGLTGISVNGVRHTRYAYYADGKAKESGLDGGIEKSSFAYGTNYTNVTNALGQTSVYHVADVNGARRVTGVDRPATGTCPAGATSTAFDAQGNTDYEVDASGVKTDYTYDADQRITQKVVGTGPNGETDQQQITIFEWDPVIKTRLLAVKLYGSSTTQPISETIYDYYPAGDPAERLLRSVKTINRSANGVANQERLISYGYTIGANRLIQKMIVDGPQAGTADQTTYQYDSAGNLTSIADPFANTTTYSNYNALGQAGRVANANGSATDYAYDARGRILTETLGTRVITYAYNGLDQVTSVTNNFGGKISYAYNGAGLLLSASLPRRTLQDSFGVKEYEDTYISLNYNLMGQSLYRYVTGMYTYQERDPEFGGWVTDSYPTTNQVSSSQYDAGGFKSSEQGGNSQKTTYTYNSNGDVETASDALGRKYTYYYDRRRRVSRVVDSDQKSSYYYYDAHGNLSQAVDPRGLATVYTRDGFGQITKLVSPDAGTTTYKYDAAGNRTEMTRADGSVTAYTYDAGNRLTNATSGGQSLAYAYDWCWNGKGKLCGFSDPSGSWTNVDYTQDGLLNARRDYIVGSGVGSDYFTYYTYDAMRRLSTIKYPDGTQARYTYNEYDGNVSRLEVNIGGVWKSVATDLQYQAFGRYRYFTFGNGLGRSRFEDASARATKIETTGLQQLDYSYNTANEVTTITNGIDAGLTQQYTYDLLSRLQSNTMGGGTTTLGYDATGNRTSIVSGATNTYTIDASSNHLSSVSGIGGGSYAYDVLGNRIQGPQGNNVAHYAYDPFNRLRQSDSYNGVSWPTTTYTSNVWNERQYKSGPMGNYRYVYTPDHQLLTEHQDNGDVWTNYLWLNGEVVGFVRAGQLYFVHADHLGRPEVVTNATKAVVWRAANQAFGRIVTQDSVGGFNLGFPGQYYDGETGLWYNLNRYYDSARGSYIQSDPIGLMAGINTYAYVDGNPVSKVDPFGLDDVALNLYGGGVIDKMPDRRGRLPDYVKVSVNVYVTSFTFTRARNGHVYMSVGANRPYPHPVSAGVSASVGWLEQPCTPSSEKLDRFHTGAGAATSGAYADVGGAVTYVPGEGFSGEVGVGTGFSLEGTRGTGGLGGDYGTIISTDGWGWSW